MSVLTVPRSMATPARTRMKSALCRKYRPSSSVLWPTHGPGPWVGHNTEEDGRYFRQRADFMRVRAGVAIDLGTVNTLIYVAGRGIVVEEPTAIALDRA